jgi:hypothetical protein
VVDDDLPALIGFFEDEGEDAVGVASIFLAAIEMIFANDYGEFFVEWVDFQLGEGERAHDGSGGVVVPVFIEHAIDAAEDLVGDEEGVGRVFVALNEGRKVAFVPSVFLRGEDFDDVEFLLGGGFELVVLRVGGESDGEDECKDCGVEAGAAWHGGHLVEVWTM